MTLLAIAVAGYSITLVVMPGLRPPFAAQLFASQPGTTHIHLTGGAIALAVGAFQLVGRLRAQYLDAHRWLGRLYLTAVIAGGIAGFLMALRSFGGAIANLGFGLLAVLWVATTLIAYARIRAGDQGAHRRWMIRSYALTLAAVTLRIYLPSSQVAGLPMAQAYAAIAWLCWVPNLLIAEWMIRGLRRVP